MNADQSLAYHSLIKIPCETYRASVRSNQKDMERELASIQRTMAKNGDMAEGREKLLALLENLHRECKIEKNLEKTLLSIAASEFPMDHSLLILDFLLRNGCVESAAQYLPSFSREGMFIISCFWRELNGIAHGDMEMRRSLSTAIAWIEKAKKGSFKLPEGIELLLRIEEFRRIEDKLEALDYAQQHFPALGGDSPMLSSAIRKAMTSLARSEQQITETQAREKWKALHVLFKAAACQCFGTLSLRAPLQIYLEAGLAALKTPQCQSGAAVARCPLCMEPDLFRLAEHLPFSRNDSSQVICRISGDIISGGGLSNAITLPNGQVFAERAIGPPDAEDFISCPLTGEKFHKDRVQKVYFL